MSIPAPVTADPVVPILQLAGTGYELQVSAATETAKADLITSATAVTQVTSMEESGLATIHIRKLAAFRLDVEKARTLVKKPVIDLGRAIDAAAGDFVAPIEAEEQRLKLMVGGHAEEVAKAKREAEAEERRKFAEAKRLKEEAEELERKAEEARQQASKAVSIADVIAARQLTQSTGQAAAVAVEQKTAANVERLGASVIVAATSVPSAVRFEPDFEVIDVEKFHAEQPALVEMTVRRGAAIAWLKGLKAEGIDIEELGPRIGLKVVLKPVVSTR